MSTTAQGIDARGYLGHWLAGLSGMIQADIQAIPDDKWTATYGGCTKCARDLTADAIAMLDWTTEALKGHPVLTEESYVTEQIKGDVATKDAACAKIKQSSEAFVAALGAASDEALNAMVTPPWRMDAPLFMIAQIAVSHIWYHDGQLNYIQCLLGDDQIHWMH